MPARNIYHAAVIQALTADGWTITHDPLTISYGGKDLFVDLAAERPAIAAEKEGKRIAVEISSFVNRSPVRDLRKVSGSSRSTEPFWQRPSPTACCIWPSQTESTKDCSSTRLDKW